MKSKRTSGAGGSARGKATDFTPKKGSTLRGLESEHAPGRGPLKSGRNLGGRELPGDRVRRPQGRVGGGRGR